ncbi:MAG: hypothetical protein ACI4XJ_05745, partial [Eubacteriales bacterium]
MDFRHGKQAEKVLSLRNPDGMWGNFHTLSIPQKGKGVTSEQALRRLWILGFTMEDEVIQTAVSRMERSLRGEEKIDSYSEKSHDWALFESLMLASWVKIFDPSNIYAAREAEKWAYIAENAFKSGEFSRDDEAAAFSDCFGRKPKSGFEVDFGMFYHVVLLRGALDEKTEGRFVDRLISHSGGIYYVYEKPLSQPPEVFASRDSVKYLAALSLVAEYPCAGEKLKFAADWLIANRGEDGLWDFGAKANDGLYFPL